MELKDKLQKEIGKRTEELNKLDATSDEYRKMVENITKLTEKYNDLMKTEYESSNCFAQTVVKKFEIKTNFVKDCVNVGKDVLCTGLKVGVTIWGTLKILEFEKTGTVTTMIGKLHVGNLIPKIK